MNNMENNNTNEVKDNNLNYDFNFENQVKQESNTSVDTQPLSVEAPVPTDTVVPTKVEAPMPVQQMAGQVVAPIKEKVEVQETLKTSGTATIEDLEKTKENDSTELMDEYSLSKDVSEEKKKTKNDRLFISIVMGIILVFIFLLEVIIKFIGY